VYAALPVASSVTVCKTVFLSRKVTEPAGVPDPGALADTFAVKVTGLPSVAGSAEEVSVVAVPSFVTVSVRFADLLPPKFASPP